ncbi:MAG: RraA family protein [Armatimonadota bacterium]|nr:RraA family protein [Armatimonadota bacterium]
MSDRVTVEFKLRLSLTRPDPASYRAFSSYATANISDAYFKRQTLPHHIKPVYAGCPGIVGPALTVQVTPGDELLPLKAIEIAQPGDVIVVVGAYSPRFSVWGGVMSTMARARGVAGLITDGLVRDVAEIKEAGLAVYAAGLTPAAPCMNVPPGELNYPILFGSAEIHPGDLMVADEDGVVCVPQRDIATVAAAVEARIAKETAWRREIERTRGMILKDTVDRLLAARTTHIEA